MSAFFGITSWVRTPPPACRRYKHAQYLLCCLPALAWAWTHRTWIREGRSARPTCLAVARTVAVAPSVEAGPGIRAGATRAARRMEIAVATEPAFVIAHPAHAAISQASAAYSTMVVVRCSIAEPARHALRYQQQTGARRTIAWRVWRLPTTPSPSLGASGNTIIDGSGSTQQRTNPPAKWTLWHTTAMVLDR